MIDQSSQQQQQQQNQRQNNIKISLVDMPMKKLFKWKNQKDNNSTEKNEKNSKDESSQTNSSSSSYITMFAAELLGTGLLMFLGCMGCVTQFDTPPAVHHMSSITFGLTVMLIIQTFGHISGAHLNPAVTLATALFGYLTPLMSINYVSAQFIGATLGYGLLKILLPDEYATEGFCATVPSNKITIIQGLTIEIVITVVLILVCCAVWDKRNVDKPDSLPLRFGFIIAAISMSAGPLTGASMNTARSFAPLVYGGSWEGQWIYWVGPNLAALIACGIYKVLFALPANDNNNELTKEESIYLEEIATNVGGEKV